MKAVVNFQRIGSTRHKETLSIKSKTSNMTYKVPSFIKVIFLVLNYLINRAPVRSPQIKTKIKIISVSQRLRKWPKTLPSVESQLRNKLRN